LAVPSAQSIETAPIHLDHEHDVVRSFVNILAPSPGTDVGMDVKMCESLLALSDMFGTPRAEQFILKSLQTSLKTGNGIPPFDAWNAFKIAAKRDDVELARDAIRCFERSGHTLKTLLTGRLPSFFDNIPPRYVYALMRCAFQPMPHERFATAGRTCNEPLHKVEAVHVWSVDQVANTFTLHD